MTNITLSIDLVNGILQYLGSRPYVEVANLITEIQKAAIPAAPIEPSVETPAA
jgi:hypothetical protein